MSFLVWVEEGPWERDCLKVLFIESDPMTQKAITFLFNHYSFGLDVLSCGVVLLLCGDRKVLSFNRCVLCFHHDVCGGLLLTCCDVKFLPLRL